MGALWDYFDKVYCISVDERADRRAEAKAQFAGIDLLDRVEFVIVKKHPSNCEQGIYESHMNCMKKGLDAGAERILIFEDDIVFERFDKAVVSNCIDFLEKQTRWHMLFLGCMVKGSRTMANPSVVKIKYRSLTHGYVIHHTFAKALVQCPWQNVPYDDFLKGLRDEDSYAVYPSFAFQSNSRSDNERYLPLDRFRRLCGGLKKLQMRNELYHRHRVMIIGAHVVVILLVLLSLT